MIRGYSEDYAIEAGIPLSEYHFPADPGECDATLTMKIWGKHKNLLCYFDTDDGERLLSSASGSAQQMTAPIVRRTATSTSRMSRSEAGCISNTAFPPPGKADFWTRNCLNEVPRQKGRYENRPDRCGWSPLPQPCADENFRLAQGPKRHRGVVENAMVTSDEEEIDISDIIGEDGLIIPELDELDEEDLKEVKKPLSNVDDVMKDMEETGTYFGAMDLSYKDFARHFKYLSNVDDRFGHNTELVLITISAKEGCRSVKVADVRDFWNGQSKIKVLDPNITACPDKRDLMRQYRETGAFIDFTQGLDIRLLDDEDIADINAMRLAEVHFAWDSAKENLAPFFKRYAEQAVHRPHGRYGTVYVLTNYNSTLDEDLYRIYTLRDLNFDPYVMVYNRPSASREARAVQRWCNNRIIFGGCKRFEDYHWQ